MDLSKHRDGDIMDENQVASTHLPRIESEIN
jgi:hypothetical protein